MVVTPFQKEAWSEYGIGTAILFLRIFARCWTVGLNWDGDDYLAVLSVLFWTVRMTQIPRTYVRANLLFRQNVSC